MKLEQITESVMTAQSLSRETLSAYPDSHVQAAGNKLTLKELQLLNLLFKQ
jgi:hypothetical protein